jgi:alkylhydroperoxidase/carboxymuconolactone decarboxylase family protein YurZ
VRGVVIAYTVPRARGVEVLTQHETASFLKAKMLLELQGSHGGDGLELVMEARGAHPQLPCEVVNPERLVEVVAYPLYGPGDAVGVTTQSHEVPQPPALFPHQEPEDDLTGDQWGEHSRLGLTRTGIDVPTRELLTFSMLVALGGCDAQVKGHVAANLNVGNDRARLIDVLTQLLPFIGYPRTLNGLRAINEVTAS